MCKLKKLRRLNLGMNKLITIPVELGELQALELIDISLNQLNNFPNEILSSQFLKSILLGGNNISKENIKLYRQYGKRINDDIDEDKYMKQ